MIFLEIFWRLSFEFVCISEQRALCCIYQFRQKNLVHRLLVYYVVYRKNQFVSLVQVRSIPVVWFFPSTVIVTSNSYWNPCSQWMCSNHSRCRLNSWPPEKLLSAGIFVEPGCPKCSTHTTCFYFSSYGNTILSLANSKPNRSVILLKTGENFSKILSFCLFLAQMFSCGIFGSIEVLCIRVSKSIKKLG